MQATTSAPKIQPRQPVNRCLRWLPGDPAAPLPLADQIRIDDSRGDVCNYTVREIDAFRGERAFELGKLDIDDPATYHIRVEREGVASCDCPGGTFKGRCKHSAAVVKLISIGKLPVPAILAEYQADAA